MENFTIKCIQCNSEFTIEGLFEEFDSGVHGFTYCNTCGNILLPYIEKRESVHIRSMVN